MLFSICSNRYYFRLIISCSCFLISFCIIFFKIFILFIFAAMFVFSSCIYFILSLNFIIFSSYSFHNYALYFFNFELRSFNFNYSAFSKFSGEIFNWSESKGVWKSAPYSNFIYDSKKWILFYYYFIISSNALIYID